MPNRQSERPALARSARTNDPRGLIYEINMSESYLSTAHVLMLENKPTTISRDETCGRTSWQESDQSDNFDRRSKFLEISSTTYIENKQYTEF